MPYSYLPRLPLVNALFHGELLTGLKKEPAYKKERSGKQLGDVQSRKVAISKGSDAAIGDAKQPGRNTENPNTLPESA